MNETNNAAFDDLCQRYWEFQCDESPVSALLAGLASPHDVLMREAPADHERRARLAAGMLAELRAFDPDTLSAQQHISARLLCRELELLVDTVAVKAHLRPMIYPLGPEAGLQFFAQYRFDEAGIGQQGGHDGLAQDQLAGLRLLFE